MKKILFLFFMVLVFSSVVLVGSEDLSRGKVTTIFEEPFNIEKWPPFCCFCAVAVDETAKKISDSECPMLCGTLGTCYVSLVGSEYCCPVFYESSVFAPVFWVSMSGALCFWRSVHERKKQLEAKKKAGLGLNVTKMD